MKIVVLVKQVPETNSVKIDEKTGTVIRKEADAIVNPLDLYAIESALLLKEILRKEGPVETTVLSMGPVSAMAVLREALSMGLDQAALLSDSSFAGSDTFATGTILSQAIRKIVPDFDLIICGERATDGDTGQVGPEIAASLDIPVVSYVSQLGTFQNNELSFSRLVEGGTEMVSVTLPALVTVTKSVASPRLPTLSGKIRARKTDIPIWNKTELDLCPERTGLTGSPTSIAKIFRPQWVRQTVLQKVGNDLSPDQVAESLASFLAERELP